MIFQPAGKTYFWPKNQIGSFVLGNEGISTSDS